MIYLIGFTYGWFVVQFLSEKFEPRSLVWWFWLVTAIVVWPSCLFLGIHIGTTLQ